MSASLSYKSLIRFSQSRSGGKSYSDGAVTFLFIHFFYRNIINLTRRIISETLASVNQRKDSSSSFRFFARDNTTLTSWDESLRAALEGLPRLVPASPGHAFDVLDFGRYCIVREKDPGSVR
ncbi:hypothetical protein EUGRSUZ_A01930 [Eucalyptus grandis]|uniref:Uncharacterized protein n=2 Tax=Eucalyptus grandis TaxID=71139 RepID=A0ACC3M617_EUCGR|nr:hypothetical protein EUGRSUZ_A01930 [Eucalyptus grandis]